MRGMRDEREKYIKKQDERAAVTTFISHLS